MYKPSYRWCLTTFCVMWAAAPSSAHEGHAALPSKGVTVVGERVYLSPGAAKAIGLETAKVSLEDVAQWVRASATIELSPSQRAKVSTLIAGRVEGLLVKPGEAVHVGQPLIHLRSPELEALQLEYLQAMEAHNLAERLLEMRTELSQSGATPAKLIAESKMEHQKTHAQLEIAAQKLLSLGVSKEKITALAKMSNPDPIITLVSPIDGVVAHVDIQLGQNVEPNQHLAEVVNLSQVYAIAHVLESDSSLVQPGMKVMATFSNNTSNPIAGVIESVGVSLNPQERVLPVRIRLDNPEGKLRPGMFGRIAIEVNQRKEAIVAPRKAIIRRGPATFVLLEESDRKYLRKPVQLGVQSGDRVEVLDGVFPGHRLVTIGSHELEALLGNPPAKKGSAQSASPSSPKTGLVEFPSQITLEAKVELPSDRQAVAVSTVPGRIARILIQPGQAVHRGDILLEIESVEARNAQLELLETHLLLEWTSQVRDRLRLLEGLESKQQLWKTETEFARLTNQLNHLASKLQFYGFSKEVIEQIKHRKMEEEVSNDVQGLLPIRSPIDGWVTQVNAVMGQTVRPDQSLVEIQDPSQVWVRGFVFEKDVYEISLGLPAAVTAPNDKALTASGVIERISPAASGVSRALSVWVPIPNTDLKFKPGMSVLLTVTGSKATPPLAADKK